MRISIVASDPRQGLLYYPAQLGNALARRGHAIQLLTWGEREQQPGLAREALAAGALVTRVPCLSRGGARALWAGSEPLKRAISAFATDILHAYGPIGAMQARGSARRTIVMVAAMGHDRRSRLPALAGARLLNFVADVVIGQCAAEVDRLRALGVDPRRVRRVLNPVDCDAVLAGAERRRGVALAAVRRALPECARLIGCFANFHPRKRHRLLLQTFESIARDLRDVGLVLAGEGEDFAACRELVDRRGLARRVCFLGRLPVEDSLGLLADVDVVAHPSVAETFGYSLVEPLLLQKSLVAAEAGVARELRELPGVSIVPPDDGERLDGALRRALASGGATRAERERAAAWVRENCEVSAVAERLEHVYAEALRGADA